MALQTVRTPEPAPSRLMVQTVRTPLRQTLSDVWTLGIENALIWGCPTHRLLAHYQKHLGDRHIEAGVGSGYLLDRARFPSKRPRLLLLDQNQSALDFSRRRLRRYAPRIQLVDLREPIEFDDQYDSAALHYVLHTLPGSWSQKAVVFAQLKKAMHTGAPIFGATILGSGLPPSRARDELLRLYNARGIFHNAHDDADGLALALQQHFERYEIELVGSIALFAGYR